MSLPFIILLTGVACLAESKIEIQKKEEA